MMFINELLYKVNKGKKDKKRKQAAQHLAAGMSVFVATGVCIAVGIFLNTNSGIELREKMKKKAMNTAESVKNIVTKSADAVEIATVHAADKVSHSIDTVHNKAEDIKEELRDGSNEIKRSVHETAENISKKLEA